MPYLADYTNDLGNIYYRVAQTVLFQRNDSNNNTQPDIEPLMPIILKQYLTFVDTLYFCKLDQIRPRFIQLTHNSGWILQIDNPIQPNTEDYFSLLSELKTFGLKGVTKINLVGERIQPYKLEVLINGY